MKLYYLKRSYFFLLFILITLGSISFTSGQNEIQGTVADEMGPIPGVSVLVKGTTRGVVSDFDGRFSIKVSMNEILVFSYLGMESQEVKVTNFNNLKITLKAASTALDEIVIVGYGAQKKESVVGAIAQTKGETLMQSGGVADVTQALQGRLPGVTTISGAGRPGSEETQIFIRGSSSWNGNGQPLILVDGVERPMSDVDANEIENISVLKDASATAVFGVQGGNGVILVTTKRGKKGRTQLSVSANTTIKVPSRVPRQLNSYDSFMGLNDAVMQELMYDEGAWAYYTPLAIAERYRNQATQDDLERYPNVDWEDFLLKDFAVDNRVNLTARGGSAFAKYFGSLSFQNVGDIFKTGSTVDNGRGYGSSFEYNRFNYRSNLDFNITKTTKASINLSGSFATQNQPNGESRRIYQGLYRVMPYLYYPRYSDGAYGYPFPDDPNLQNPYFNLTAAGYTKSNRLKLNTDISLEQKLDFIAKGLVFKGLYSYDSYMTSTQNINDGDLNGVFKFYDQNGEEQIVYTIDPVNDFQQEIQPWELGNINLSNGSRTRNLNYQASLNYNNTFADDHNVSGLFLFRRQERTRGSNNPRFREDWVGRVTYNYKNTYFIEVNGAYNGSEQFAKGYRFDLFPSLALGWTLSNNDFLQDTEWLNKLKIRGSYGVVGDDNYGGQPYGYLTQWADRGTGVTIGSALNYRDRSDYLVYYESLLGNPNLRWEVVTKANIGAEVSLLNGAISSEFDFFLEKRDDIFISADDRAVPNFVGIAPPSGNLGQAEVKGFEVTLKLNHTLNNGMKVWLDANYNRAVDKVISRDEPLLAPSYTKDQGFQIGQTRRAIPTNIMQSWDDIYTSTPLEDLDDLKRIGGYDIVDFNGDGLYKSIDDIVPYGYPNRPQNNWSATFGWEWKNFSVMAQFYGMNNVSRSFATGTAGQGAPAIFDFESNYWTKDNPNAAFTHKSILVNGRQDPFRNLWDASMVRLKTCEIAYKIPKKTVAKLGAQTMRVFVNGNNLFLWSDVPDDRVFDGVSEKGGTDYPAFRRINFGFNLNF